MDMEKSPSSKPIVKEELVEALRACGLREGDAVIAHCAMSKLGYVVGGAETVIRSILEIIGDEGTIVMPAQTWKNLDPATGVHWETDPQWWPLLREQWPAYDARVTPSIGMGTVAEALRTWPGARRSAHPARSFAAVGKHAEAVVEGHDLRNIFGEQSPLDKLYRLHAKILLIGVGYDKNTSLHLAETRADFPSKSFADEASAMLIEGRRNWVVYSTQAVDDSDFLQLGEQYEQEHPVQVLRIGEADIRCLPQRQLVDWAAAWMERHRL